MLLYHFVSTYDLLSNVRIIQTVYLLHVCILCLTCWIYWLKMIKQHGVYCDLIIVHLRHSLPVCKETNR